MYMYTAGNMAAPHHRGSNGRGAPDTGRGTGTTSKSAMYAYPASGAKSTSRSAVVPGKGTTETSKGAMSRGKGVTNTGAAGANALSWVKGATVTGRVTGVGAPALTAQWSTSDQIYDTPQQQEEIYFILLKDIEVQGKPSESILSQRHGPSSKKILRGSLLQGRDVPHGKGPRSHNRSECRFLVRQLNGDVRFECGSSEVARITLKEKDLLEAISTDSMRLHSFQDEELLPYALGLKQGSSVKVQHRNDSTSLFEDVNAVVRYIGPLQGNRTGTQFGIELIDAKHRGQGTSDGEFCKKRYFETEPDCALFVPITKLVPSPEPSVYENTPRLKQKLPEQLEELTIYGEIQKGMTVGVEDGSSWSYGKVVHMVRLPGMTEPHIVVEVPSTTGGQEHRWNGYFNSYHVYTPKEGVKTFFVPANGAIQENLLEPNTPEEQQEAVIKEQVSNLVLKEKSKGRKSSEPFFLANNKTRKTSSPYASSERLDKGGNKASGGRRDVSDSYHHGPAHRNEMGQEMADDLPFSSGHFAEGGKPKHDSFVDIVKGRVGKFKNKFNSGSKDEETSKSSWYASERSIDPEARRGSFPETRTGDKDYLEQDVVKEVADTIHKNWKEVGRGLYLGKDEIEAIHRKYSTERERTEEMLKAWQKKGAGYDKISRLAVTCRNCGFEDLANELEQGLDEEILLKIASGISPEKARPFGVFLNFSDAELDRMERETLGTLPRVRVMLAKWRARQSQNSDKIMLLSNALRACGLRQLQLEVARGLDDDIMLSFAVQIANDWKILAQTLRLSLKDIKHLEDFSLDKQPYQMLMLWRRKQHRSVDVLGALSKGLRESGLVDLAHELVQGVDDEMLYKLSTLIGVEWESLALHLQFSDEEVKSLKKQNSPETLTINNMLTKWRERHDYTNNRFIFLMDALRNCDLKKIADAFEMDNLRASQPKMQEATVKKERHPGYPQTKEVLPDDICREDLVKVSKQLNYRDLSVVIGLLNTEDFIEIENQYPTNEQRVFNALDCWKRRGEGGRRSMGELLQVLAHLGGNSALIDDIMKSQATDTKEEVQGAKDLLTELNLPIPLLEDDPFDAPPSPDLEINSMVEVPGMSGSITRYGVIRWIGIPEGSKSAKLVAGIELESSIAQGTTDGTFNKLRYFHCEPHKAMFVYLSQCQPDSRFPSQSQTFNSKHHTSQDFGGFASPLVEGFIDPPPALKSYFVGMQKGIQGDQNSCYLDTTLFSMFAYNSVFDPLLRRSQGKDDLQLYEEVQKTLRESIVNPLRKNGFVRADRILQLREHLDNLGTTKGLMSEEKDPEEFLHTLLSEVFKSKPLLKIRHGANKAVDESNIYQIFLDKDESFTLPTVEQLLLQSFQEHDLKLVKAPSCMIVQMPRFGKEYKMYKRILPSLQLDVTNITEGYPRQCVVCGNLAVFECNSCKSEEALVETTHIKNYCESCYDMMHVNTKRAHHKPELLIIPDPVMKEFFSKTVEKGFSPEDVDSHRQMMLTPKFMNLFAVICIRTSHYVAFVKAGRETDSEWVFFDSMADRQGDQQGYNIPQITHLKDFRSWVNVEHIKERIESRQLTELMERLLGDAYICMYSDAATQSMTYV